MSQHFAKSSFAPQFPSIDLPQDEVDEIECSFHPHIAVIYLNARKTVHVARHCWIQHADLIEAGSKDHLEMLWESLEHERVILRSRIQRAKDSWLPVVLSLPVRRAIQEYTRKACEFRQSVLDACEHARYAQQVDLILEPIRPNGVCMQHSVSRADSDYARLDHLPELADDGAIAGIFSQLKLADGQEPDTTGFIMAEPARGIVAS
ncbi:hypothetical protein PUNSTDRAFT_139796 [Punctularia strigosozonata HHB-11173 SS5]|uniref:uncharacterized protein n=1 Tax=Punctularia strigosozonata (strain HHB-11173) TaxID=741275 RepID=UPI0004417B5B|nr:uncharacterized protein PUNSTDRAFT_139796 [Punctularia strigosozonata HHB-11173 SS5]EIN13148.1 hypothetical protein PUNSTDRAFT_139796 [Punctularia strigosozonata HHB-11173 SS5]